MHSLEAAPIKLYSVTSFQKNLNQTKPNLAWDAVRKKQVAVNWIDWLPYKYLMVLCCALKVSDLFGASAEGQKYLVATLLREWNICSCSCLFITTKKDFMGMSDGVAEISYRALFCPPLLHFTSRREVGLLVRLTVFWTCVWFRQSPRSALPLLILDGFVFLTAGVLHLNSGEVSAILGSSIITAHIPGAVRWHGIMKMCQAANCLKQLL